MSYREALDGTKIAISISDSENMNALGLSEAHLVEAMCEVARHSLALGATLIYGGDLRARGFTQLLFELVSRYRKDSIDFKNVASVISYLPWPTIAKLTPDDLKSLKADLADTADVCLLDVDGNPTSFEFTDDDKSLAPKHWVKSLKQMRIFTTNEASARVVLGGKTQGFMGDMPGIAEEVLTSLLAQKPVYLFGGFGGCTRDILEIMGVHNPHKASAPNWPGSELFSAFNFESLKNGLSHAENFALATTPYIDQAATLMIRGLLNITSAPKSQT
ncbi:MAG: hypothetical protein E2591_19920 [Achromobacter sp.]|uniref:hypothetical protein n=1 Tax=Achromobacter sp. TaxID=134375 RepID=UPI0012C95138|nr:hypothetical protein [Achromobacter sp.]MPS80340.1 hypothetical protein [Achromobacter sp.]